MAADSSSSARDVNVLQGMSMFCKGCQCSARDVNVDTENDAFDADIYFADSGDMNWL